MPAPTAWPRTAATTGTFSCPTRVQLPDSGECLIHLVERRTVVRVGRILPASCQQVAMRTRTERRAVGPDHGGAHGVVAVDLIADAEDLAYHRRDQRVAPSRRSQRHDRHGAVALQSDLAHRMLPQSMF